MKTLRVVLILSLSSLFLLTACDDKIVQEVQKQQEKQHADAKKKKAETKAKKETEKKIYDDLSKPLNQVVDSADKDRKKIVDKQYVVKDSYTDPVEFEKFAAKNIFDFYSFKISPDEYYSFLIKYGSKEMLKEQKVLEKKESGVLFLTNVQGLLKDNGALGDDYTISELTFNSAKNEAYFYRKVQLVNRQFSYFITTIVKENDEWKLLQDSPSEPFDESSGSSTEEDKNE